MEKHGHHIALITFLIVVFISLQLTQPFLSTNKIWYILAAIIALIMGILIPKLFHETKKSKKELLHIYIITNIFIPLVQYAHVLAAITTFEALLLANQLENIKTLSNFNLLNPYTFFIVIFVFFNIPYTIHLIKEQEYKKLTYLIIPVAIYILLDLIRHI